MCLQAVAVIATALAWLPQTVKSLRSADRTGVSVSSWILGAATGLVFALYGISTHVWSLVGSEGAFAVGALVVVGTVIGLRRTLTLAALAVVLSILTVRYASADAIGVVGIIGTLGMRVLQLLRTLKTRSVAGMSSASWILLTLNVAAWGLYGLLAGRWPLVVTSAVALASATALLLVSHNFKRTAARTCPRSTI